MASVGADLHVHITIVVEGQLIGIAIEVADKGLSIHTVEGALNL